MESIKKQITIENVGFIIILLTIVLLNIFIGSNIKQPIWIIQALVSVFTLMYLILKKVKKESNLIIKGRIDIAVLLFMVSTAIPLILKKYVSLEGTCNFILKYWSVYGFYLLVRNIVVDKQKINTIMNTVIVSSIIPIVFGIDKLGLNIFEPFLDTIRAVKIEDVRMISTFGYANTFAAYLGLVTSLAISQFISTNKIVKKVLYAIYIIIGSITIILTQSKFVLALLVFIIFIFIIKGIKDKKINAKWITLGIIVVILFFIYFIIAIKIDKPLEINEKEKNCVIRGIESNTNYKFEFDISSETDKQYNTIEIDIVEITRYFSEKTIGNINFSKYNGIKTINVKTNSEIDHIEIRIKNPLKQKLTINKLKINDEPYILEYKIIPEEVVRVFTTFNFKNSSVWQRVDYWRDAIEIIQDRWLLGTGGNTWRVTYGQVQDYLYYAKEGHCYILEVWMSFGLLGIASYIFIIAIMLQNGIELLKNNKENVAEYRNILAIIVGVSIIVIHSLMDFDMSFLIIEMIFYMFLAIINIEDKKINKNTKYVDILIIIILLCISIGNTLGLIATILEKDDGKASSNIAGWISKYQYNKIIYTKNSIEDIRKYINNEPYQNQNIMYEIMCNEIIGNTDKDDIEFLIHTWKNIKRERTYEITAIQKRAEIMLNFAEQLLEKTENTNDIEFCNYAKEILEIVVKEYEENNKIILDYKRNRELEVVTKYKYEYYTEVYNKSLEILKQMQTFSK